MKNIKKSYLNICQKIGTVLQSPTSGQAQVMLFVLGVGILSFGLYSEAMAGADEPVFNDDRISDAFDRILTFLEGSFGALIMVAAGLGAILSSAFGQYKAALGCLVVAVGTFILRSFISTFFNTEGSALVLPG